MLLAGFQSLLDQMLSLKESLQLFRPGIDRQHEHTTPNTQWLLILSCETATREVDNVRCIGRDNKTHQVTLIAALNGSYLLSPSVLHIARFEQ